MEDMFRSSWRTAIVPIILTALVAGAAIGFAFYA
jgi:hypothetical protein